MQGSKRCYVRMRRLYLIIQAQARMDSLQIHEILLRWLARRKTRWCCSKTDDRLNWSIICMPRKLERSIFLGNRFRLNFSIYSNVFEMYYRCIHPSLSSRIVLTMIYNDVNPVIFSSLSWVFVLTRIRIVFAQRWQRRHFSTICLLILKN